MGEAIVVRFRVLGSLEVFDGVGWTGIGAPRCRSMVASLLAGAGEAFSMDRLVFELWGDSPPKTAVTQIHGYVSRIRRLTGDTEGRVLTTTSNGYRIVLAEHGTDAALFEARAEEGLAALRAGQPGVAAEALRQALDLWRGPAFSDVAPTHLVAVEAYRLTELRLAAWETRVEADLQLGDHATLVPELQRHVEEHPLRERPWRQLMLALDRAGRRAEALQAYVRVRRILVDEVGVEPSEELHVLHQELLGGPTAVVVERHEPPAAPVCQLPADVPDFAGRREPLDVIAGRLDSAVLDGPPPVTVIFGGPGVGKSTVAVHAAHAARPAYPDGQLYLDLGGTSDEPRDPAVLLAEVLQALGVSGAAVPDELPARATRYRSLLADRRILLMLDDAAHVEQVTPLVPPTGGCALIVTSRRPLTGMAGAQHIELDVLPAPEAHELFTSIVGRTRVAREPRWSGEIVRSCGHLPLAIRIAAGKLVGRPGWSLRVLAERLADESRRLSELRLGEIGVRASFDLSQHQLPHDAVRVFGLLGLLGPQTFPGWVLGPLLDRPDTDEVLDTLVDASLVRPTNTDPIGEARYRLHDLLRAYAVEGAQAIPTRERDAAVARVLGAWLHLTTSMMERLPPSLFRPPPGPTPHWPVLPRTAASADPLSWFDAERPALLAAIHLAVDRGLHDAAWELAAVAVPFYDVRSAYEDWQRSHHLALGAVRAAGNLLGEAVLTRGLAQVQIFRDHYDDAAANLRRSVQLCQELGDKRGEALATASLATISRTVGDYPTALEHATRALDAVTAAGDQHTEAQLRNSIGMIRLAQGHPHEARTWFEEALAVADRLGDRHRVAAILREMSQAYDRTGDTERALAGLRQAMEIFTELEDDRCVAQTLLKEGRLHAAHHDVERATAALAHGAAIFARLDSKLEEAKCWQALGDVEDTLGHVDQARQHLRRALSLWQAAGATGEATSTAATLARLDVGGM
jgi:DNA-binding SARP family transcriptional activator/Tfp pilus assembly protein PilF